MRIILLLLFINLNLHAKDELTIALIPYQMQGGLKYHSFEQKVKQKLLGALKDKAHLVILPELISFDMISNNFEGDTHKEVIKGTKYFDRYLKFLKSFSKNHSVNIMGGSFQRLVDNKIYNTAIFVSSKGSHVLQDKIFVTPWEKKYGFSNGELLHLFKIEGVLSVILNCHDVEFPLISHRLSAYRPKLFIVPSMTDDHFGYQRVSRTSMSRAIEHMSFVAQVGVTSSDQGNWHSYFGAADLYAPQNNVLGVFEKKGETNKNTPLILNISPKTLKEYRKNHQGIYPIRDQLIRQEVLEIP